MEPQRDKRKLNTSNASAGSQLRISEPLPRSGKRKGFHFFRSSRGRKLTDPHPQERVSVLKKHLDVLWPLRTVQRVGEEDGGKDHWQEDEQVVPNDFNGPGGVGICLAPMNVLFFDLPMGRARLKIPLEQNCLCCLQETCAGNSRAGREPPPNCLGPRSALWKRPQSTSPGELSQLFQGLTFRDSTPQ